MVFAACARSRVLYSRASNRSLCSGPDSLAKRVEAAAAKGDLAECRRLLQVHDVPSVVDEVQKAQAATQRRLVRRCVAGLLAYTSWNGAATVYAYRVLGAEAEKLLAERGYEGAATLELHLKPFSLRGEVRPPAEKADALTLADEPYRPPIESKWVRVMPLIHISALWLGRSGSEWRLWCRKSKGMSEFRRPASSSSLGASGPRSPDS